MIMLRRIFLSNKTLYAIMFSVAVICSVLFGYSIGTAGTAPSANGSPDGGTVTLSYTQSGTKYKKTYHHAKVASLSHGAGLVVITQSGKRILPAKNITVSYSKSAINDKLEDY